MKAVRLILIQTLMVWMKPSDSDESTRLTEDVGWECDSDSECLPSIDCQYFQEQQNLLKSLTDRTARINMIQDLREAFKNKNDETYGIFHM